MWSSPTIYYLLYLGDDNMTDNTQKGSAKCAQHSAVLNILSPSAYILQMPSKTGHTIWSCGDTHGSE